MTAAEVVPANTAQLEQLSPAARELAVTQYLAHARDQLALAVEATGPAAVAAVKAEIATAAEATKQLGLSKDIQQDAQEMVRRAEYAVRKAVDAAQKAGEASRREDSLRAGTEPRGPQAGSTGAGRAKPASFFSSKREYEAANAMADLTEDEFNEVLDEARAEDNMSRSNVADKARKKAGRAPAKPRRKKPITDEADEIGWDYRRLTDRLGRLVSDDRLRANEKQVANALRGHLLYVAETVAAVLDQLP